MPPKSLFEHDRSEKNCEPVHGEGASGLLFDRTGAAHRPFRGLLSVHSRYSLHTRAITVFRDSFTEGFNRFVTSTVAPVAFGWSSCRVGLSPTGKRRLFTAHPESRRWRQAAPGQLRSPRALTTRLLSFCDCCAAPMIWGTRRRRLARSVQKGSVVCA
jgi:hypothetical protein